MNRGFALITVLAVAIIIALGSATLLQSMASLGSMKTTTIRETRARFLVEAAMQHALYVCKTNAAGCVDDPNFTVSINVDGTAYNIPTPIDITPAGNNLQEISVTTEYADEYDEQYDP